MTSLPIRFGTRGSALARWQTDHVIALLHQANPDSRAESVIIRTEGDIDQTSSLVAIGGRGVFTSALQQALRLNRIDAAVHSAKDLPSFEPDGLQLVALLSRDDPRDVLVSRHGLPLELLPPNPTIGTSSRRRAAQVLKIRPDARIIDLRGNIDTRLRKSQDELYDGIVIAAAGLSRLGLTDRVTQYLPIDVFVPSPGQGALAIEARSDDPVGQTLAGLDDARIHVEVTAERAFLRAVGGGCTAPIAAHATIDAADRLTLHAMLGREDGTGAEWASLTVALADAEAVALELAHELLHRLGMQPDTTWTIPDLRLPLEGVRVVVAQGSEEDRLAPALQALGATTVDVPTIEMVEAPDDAPIIAAAERVSQGSYDWIVFTSKNAVERFLSRLPVDESGAPLVGSTRIAAVGSSTAERIQRYGLDVAVLPQTFTADAVVDELVQAGIAGLRVLFPRGDISRDIVPTRLRDAGARVDDVIVYRNAPVTTIDPEMKALLQEGSIDVVALMSPSGAKALVNLLDGNLGATGRASAVCIGPVTGDAARDLGYRVDLIPSISTIEGIVDAIALHWRTISVAEPMASGKHGG